MSARALVLGLDGAEWSVIHALGLPNLSRLAKEGLAGPLRSTTPPMTLPAWTSFLTGVNPGQHGIFDFTRRVPGQYRVEFRNATHLRVPTLLQHLSGLGGRVASIAVPGTWPPQPLNGLVIAGFDSPVATTATHAHAWPPARYAELCRQFGPLHYADFPESRPSSGWHALAHQRLLAEIDRKEALCAHLLREEWDLFMVVFGESDTAAHHFWRYYDPKSPRYASGLDTLAAVYRRLDAAVGRLAAQADRVCIASDHGFGGASGEVLYLNRFLQAQGWLHMGGPSGEGLRQLALGLPVEALVRRLPPALLGRAESQIRYGAIDFSRTRAWSDELSYAPTLHLNVRGREPQGLVARDAAILALTKLLHQWQIRGQPVVRRVWRREELYAGPAIEDAPDLVLELEEVDGYSRVLLPSGRAKPGQDWRALTSAEHQGGKGLGTNGTHRADGVLILSGRGISPGKIHADITDPLPTLIERLGAPLPAWVEGRSLCGEGPRVQTPITPPSAHTTTPAEAGRLRRVLEGLGYL